MALASAFLPSPQAAAAGHSAMPIYAPVGDVTTPPSGYLQFCKDNPADCRSGS